MKVHSLKRTEACCELEFINAPSNLAPRPASPCANPYGSDAEVTLPLVVTVILSIYGLLFESTVDTRTNAYPLSLPLSYSKPVIVISETWQSPDRFIALLVLVAGVGSTIVERKLVPRRVTPSGIDKGNTSWKVPVPTNIVSPDCATVSALAIVRNEESECLPFAPELGRVVLSLPDLLTNHV